MHMDEADVILTLDELDALIRTWAPQPRRLALLPSRPPDATPGDSAFLRNADLPAAAQADLQQQLRTLNAPTKAVEVHISLADERLWRQTLAWSTDGNGDPALFNASATTIRIGRRSTDAVRHRIRNVLAVEVGLPVENLSVPLPTQAIVTLLAIIDHLRYARRYAELVYEPPVAGFTPREVLARLEDAEIDDFRWPLLFFEKLVLPGALRTYTAATIAAGLAALQEAELIAPLTDDPIETPAPDQLYELLPAGEVIADTVLHEVSKVGLVLTECLPDTTAPDGGVGIGLDTGLLVRGATRLALFFVSGVEGAVALLDADDLTNLLNAFFEAPSAEAEALSQTTVQDRNARTTKLTATPPPTTTPAPRFCSQCGSQIKADSRFCARCGAPVGH